MAHFFRLLGRVVFFVVTAAFVVVTAALFIVVISIKIVDGIDILLAGLWKG